MSWWTDNRQTVVMTIVRWGLGYLLGRTAAADLDPSTQQPLPTNDGQQLNDAAQKGDNDNGKNS